MYKKIQYPFYNKANIDNMKTYNNYRYSMNNQNTHYLERKQDARKKIMLGGLIIKAGLDYLHPKDDQALYGMLLVSKMLLASKPEMLEQWREIGKDLKKI
ncbi:conjugal transfer protein TraD [Candidatus Tisiphia endosymbiont of Melanophora roralis]|uniref:conjugal transfer protein TraD n=1 Tax=Candidatus Tisiphia endosymbiont of Melanophora roralis TaxID=3066261 RepID=UPI00312C71B9